jgi:hypothetical protein
VKERCVLKDVGMDGNIILKRTSKEWDGRAWNNSVWLRMGTIGRLQ